MNPLCAGNLERSDTTKKRGRAPRCFRSWLINYRPSPMKTYRSILHVVIATALMLLFIDGAAFAQRAGEPTVVKMPTPAQQTAINALNASIQQQQQKVLELQTTLNEAPLTMSPNDAAIEAAVKALQVAERELALAKASGFAKLQASRERLSPELIPMIDISAASDGPGGGGFFGRGNRPSPEDMAAIDAFRTALEDEQEHVTQLRTSLSEAIYSLPSNDTKINAAVDAVITAEQELAHARATEVLKLKASLDDPSPESVQRAVAMASRRGGFGRQAPIPADDLAGFKPIFDGKTLNGWDGDPMFWRAEDGMIVAESTPEKVVQENTFLIWRAGMVKDFELKLEARFAIDSGNSGIQIRSRALTASRRNPGQERKWGVGGYQIDMVAAGGTGSGLIYGEGGGGFLARQGTITRRTVDGLKQIGMLGDNIPSYFNPAGEWNSFHVVAKGNTISVYVNGRLTSVLIDEHVDPELGFALEGLLALQMHVGDPFRLEFKNIYLKEL